MSGRRGSSELEQLIDTISREFHDEAPGSSRTRVYRMWDSSNLLEDAFIDLMYKARKKTMERPNIVKEAAPDGLFKFKNKVLLCWLKSASARRHAARAYEWWSPPRTGVACTAPVVEPGDAGGSGMRWCSPWWGRAEL
jgi:hypothetical protein